LVTQNIFKKGVNILEYYSDDYLLKNTKIKENNEKLVAVKEYAKTVIISHPLSPRKKQKIILVRETVAKMLNEVTKLLPTDYDLMIYGGYREEKTQRLYFLNYTKKLKKLNPNWDEQILKEEASKYVANPDSVSPHLTGGAVDVSLAKNKRQIPMGGFIDNKEGITEKIKENRKLLKDIMEKVGFVNYPLEWWHWSYGDRYWAAVKKKEYAIYNEIKSLNKN